MQVLLDFLGQIYELFNIPMNIYGFTFSFWDVMMFSLIVGVIFGFVRHMFYEN